MDMDLTFPATSTAPPEPPAAVAGPLPAAAAACRELPSPRFAVVARSPPPLSPPPPPAAAPPPVTSGGAPTLTAVAPPAGAGGDATEEDRMDLLWEDFNEELARAGSCCCRAAAGGGPWPASDSESEPAAARGCAPVLRPSSRAGAVRHCRRRAGTWALLMRIFRRLFVVEKTVVSRRQRHRAAAKARAR
jgi:hypothetical protein